MSKLNRYVFNIGQGNMWNESINGPNDFVPADLIKAHKIAGQAMQSIDHEALNPRSQHTR